jgi:hypothetical protein
MSQDTEYCINCKEWGHPTNDCVRNHSGTPQNGHSANFVNTKKTTHNEMPKDTVEELAQDVEGIVLKFEINHLRGLMTSRKTDIKEGLERLLQSQADQYEREKGEIESAYCAGITKIASELRGAGFQKTADLIDRDLETLKANPTKSTV